VKRRVLVIAAVALSLLSGASAAQALGDVEPADGGYWGCVGSEILNRGICVRNPMPSRLPVPESTPTV
jgi:hypothetical protein